MILIAILLTAILCVAGVAFDGSAIYLETIRMQGAADAAAIGAALEVKRGNKDYDLDVLPAALADARLNGYPAAGVSVEYPHTVESGDAPAEHVAVSIRARVNTLLLGVIDSEAAWVSVHAVARATSDGALLVE